MFHVSENFASKFGQHSFAVAFLRFLSTVFERPNFEQKVFQSTYQKHHILAIRTNQTLLVELEDLYMNYCPRHPGRSNIHEYSFMNEHVRVIFRPCFRMGMKIGNSVKFCHVVPKFKGSTHRIQLT